MSPRTLNDWWRTSLETAGVEHRRLHAARHTAASQLIAKGATPAVVAEWLGHADGGVLVLRTYSHVNGGDLRMHLCCWSVVGWHRRWLRAPSQKSFLTGSNSRGMCQIMSHLLVGGHSNQVGYRLSIPHLTCCGSGGI